MGMNERNNYDNNTTLDDVNDIESDVLYWRQSFQTFVEYIIVSNLNRNSRDKLESHNLILKHCELSMLVVLIIAAVVAN